MRIFFSGGIAGPWMSGWQRCRALTEMGHEVIPFQHSGYLSRALNRNPLLRIQGKLYKEDVVEEFNREILERLLDARPEIAWFEWPMLLRNATLERAASSLPGCTLVSFQDDNPFGTRRGEQQRWQYFLEAIPGYDLHLVKRVEDMAAFQARGARRAQLFRHGYYAPLFRPLPRREVPLSFQQDVCFVGTPLDHRVETVSELIRRHKLPLMVYGNRWNRTLVYHVHRERFRSEVLAEDYVRVICGSQICLGFVSSSNRDEYSMRTFEVPACRGFFLAERTPAHQELFEEGKEAEFFYSPEECADKIRFYLRAESERSRIAEEGYRRCLRSDYSLHSSLAKAVAQIQSLQE